MNVRSFVLAGLLAGASSLMAADPAVLASGHTDLGLEYDSLLDEWNLHVGSEDTGEEYAPGEVVLQVGALARTTVPADPAFAFLGAAGTRVWILPQTQNEQLLFLGYGAEHLPEGVFTGNQVRVSLRSVTGPGDFFSYRVDGFGQPVVLFNTRDGITANDATTVQAGGEAHLNWAFTAPGTYVVEIEAAGTLVNGNRVTSSGPVAFTFEVLPAVVQLTNQHVDLRVLYDANATNRLSLVALDKDTHTSHPADETVLVVPESARLSLPDGTPFGAAGAPIWVLPQSQNPDLLFLGISAEGIAANAFSNGSLGLQLKSVNGPGNFFLWQASQFGGFEVRMNSADGISAADATTPLVGSHEHFNWGFTAPGIYQITLQASARIAGETTNTTSLDTVFTFHVLPLPATSPFAQWQRKHWPEGTPNNVQGPAADPDGDGVVNLVEFALNLDPASGSRAGLPVVSFVANGGMTYGALSFTRVKTTTDVTYTVLAASSVAGPWQELTAIHAATDQGETERVSIRDEVATTTAVQRFYRLQVSLRP
jgi:surface-anchored protein